MTSYICERKGRDGKPKTYYAHDTYWNFNKEEAVEPLTVDNVEKIKSSTGVVHAGDNEGTFCGKSSFSWMYNLRNWTVTTEPITCRSCMIALGKLKYQTVLVET